MSESTINAIIGACGAVLAAIVSSLIALWKKRKSSADVFIKQKQKGEHNQQIGNITIVKNGEKTHERNCK